MTLGNEPDPLSLFLFWEKEVLFPWPCCETLKAGLAHSRDSPVCE